VLFSHWGKELLGMAVRQAFILIGLIFCSITKSDKLKKDIKNDQICIFGFQHVAKNLTE